MRLASIKFTNFRCFRKEIVVFSDYTALVGPNNCGKSTVMRALNIFFGEGTKQGEIQESDFSVGTDESELSIKVEFENVVGEAEKELSHYVRDNKLAFEIVAERNEQGVIKSKCRGIRYGLERLAPYFAAQKAGQKKPIYEDLKKDTPELTTWKNIAQADSEIREFEQKFPDDFVQLTSEENAYGATGPIPKLRKFLDWIYVPAVKDVSTEASEQRNSAFSKLVMFSVRAKVNIDEEIGLIGDEATQRLADVLDNTTDAIDSVGNEIFKEFRALSTTNISIALEWDNSQPVVLNEPKVRTTFKDGEFIESPDNFGHGIQRTYIMALLRVATQAQAEVENFNLILGIEEPELYQHPPQAKFLSTALSELANGNSQVLITTHSPYFVTGRNFESIRSLKKTGNRTIVNSWTIDEQRSYCAKRLDAESIGQPAALSGLDRTLQTNIAEMFFAQKVVFVEGAEDEAIISEYLRFKDCYSQFLMSGGHIVSVGGKQKIPMLIALARGMSIDTFCVFDFDMDKPVNNRKNDRLQRYAIDVDLNIPDEILEDYSSPYFYAFKNNIQESIQSEHKNWSEIQNHISQEWGWKAQNLKKDPMLLEEAIKRTTKSNGQVTTLDKLVSQLLLFLNR